jgi:hypothetical protein
VGDGHRADGTYSLGGLASGIYTVSFSASGYLTQYYKDAESAGSAKHVTLASGAMITGVDAQLQLAGGTYRLSFEGLGSDYAKQFFGGASLASATGVPVTAGATTANIDVQLNRAKGTIAGTVTDGARCGMGAQVAAYDASGTPVASVSTAADGSYTVAGLAPGFYRVGFAAGGCTGDFYGGAATLAGAGAILVVSGTTAEGIDEKLGGTGTSPPESTPTPESTLTPEPTSTSTTSSQLVPTIPASPKSNVAGTRVVFQAKPLTQAHKLAKALTACGKLKKSKRAKCVAAARKRYPPKKPKAKVKPKAKT